MYNSDRLSLFIENKYKQSIVIDMTLSVIDENILHILHVLSENIKINSRYACKSILILFFIVCDDLFS